ncbi:hypothetical protein [Taylorella equigenitalis]|uniref:hypothetical protein n=1 Tax=Taylorella equigenitalis TaxID=29575 RepID=UPI0023AF1AB2|nr:hypothetical protein [Taylorella equigenitalis]WED99894.1 hypothetical protein PZB79_04750 [Taylorella equigenitalis]WEE01372.1 hypothetical protein PZB80_04760 [Taylorella equigenitalis]WFE08155.1 hypothetical protein P7C91_04770 [Taylorella equigenitalis]
MHHVENDLSFFENYFDKKKNPIKSDSKILCSDPSHKVFLCNFEGKELSADIDFLSYEDALRYNKFFSNDHPELNNKLWIIAFSGQGDYWFIDNSKNLISWFNHEEGEFDYSKLLNFPINFVDFVKFAQLVGVLDNENWKILNTT